MSKRRQAAKRAYRAAKRIGEVASGMKTWAREHRNDQRMSMPLRGGAFAWTPGGWLDAKAHPAKQTKRAKSVRVAPAASAAKKAKTTGAKT